MQQNINLILKKRHCPGATAQVLGSASYSAETSVRSPRKLLIFTIKKNIFWIKVSKKKLFNFEKKALVLG